MIRLARRSYFYPYRAVQSGLAREIACLAPSARHGVLVDVGCGLRPYEGLFEVDRYIGVDVAESGRPDRMKRPDIYYDGRSLPFDDQTVDHILCTQVLQYVPEPSDLFQEFARVLKQAGNLILSAPQSEPVTERPFDRFRFTRDGLAALCRENGFEILKMQPAVGYWQSLAYDLNCLAASALHHRGGVGKAVLAATGCLTQTSAAVLDLVTSYKGNVNAWVVHAVREPRHPESSEVITFRHAER